MKISDFDYALPNELIAQYPLAQRSDSRLLVLNQKEGLKDSSVRELPGQLCSGDLLVFNDSRVIPARLRAKKITGGLVELLVEKVVSIDTALCHLKASHKPSAGSTLTLELNNAQQETMTLMAREEDLFLMRFERPVLDVLAEFGEIPLPPYIQRPVPFRSDGKSTAAESDHLRYQTVWAKDPGSVAAPTAGLHFDEPLLQRLRDSNIQFAYVTLHVGAGTFQPVRQEIEHHIMHREWYRIPQATVDAIAETRKRGGRVICVGTTSLRTLETAAQHHEITAHMGETQLFIKPGFQFKVADRLLTNFHLPKSTLFMLVSAFAGLQNTQSAYQHAINHRYRFFSYGDAMLVDRP